MVSDDEAPSGAQLRLEWLHELRKLWEWRPGQGNFFDIHQVWERVRDRTSGKISKELAEAALNSLLQEDLARAYLEGNAFGIQITNTGLHYLAEIEAETPTKEVHVDKQIIIGNIIGSNVNIDSMLEQVTQSISSAPNLDEAGRKQLAELIEQLKIELQKAPPTKKEAVEAIAAQATALVKASTEAQPNKINVQITADGLKKAAENIAGVMPIVLTIASSIVKTVFQLVGVPLP